jgi:hypothetical protein
MFLCSDFGMLLTNPRRSAIIAAFCTNVTASYQSGPKTSIRLISLLPFTGEDGRWDIQVLPYYVSKGYVLWSLRSDRHIFRAWEPRLWKLWDGEMLEISGHGIV